MMGTWSDSEDDSTKKEKEKKVANMYFIVIDESDEVNSNLSYDDSSKTKKIWVEKSKVTYT